MFRNIFINKFTSRFFSSFCRQHPVEPLKIQFEKLKRNPNYQHNMNEMDKLLADIKNNPHKYKPINLLSDNPSDKVIDAKQEMRNRKSSVYG